MSEHTVKEQMRRYLGQEVTAHIARVTTLVEAAVPMVQLLSERVQLLEAEVASVKSELTQRLDRIVMDGD